MNSDLELKITPILKEMAEELSEVFILKVWGGNPFSKIAEEQNISIDEAILHFRCAMLYIKHVLSNDEDTVNDLMEDPSISAANKEITSIFKSKIDIDGTQEKLKEIAGRADAASPENKREVNIQAMKEMSELTSEMMEDVKKVFAEFFRDRKAEDEFEEKLRQIRPLL